MMGTTVAGKLTIQSWQEEQERKAEREAYRQEQLERLGREIDSLKIVFRPRRRRTFLQRMGRWFDGL